MKFLIANIFAQAISVLDAIFYLGEVLDVYRAVGRIP